MRLMIMSGQMNKKEKILTKSTEKIIYKPCYHHSGENMAYFYVLLYKKSLYRECNRLYNEHNHK